MVLLTEGERLVVMGVAGAGKSTIGRALADRLALPYGEADEFHPPANVAKMRAGAPLDDNDRAPWLAAVGAWLADQPGGGVASCSALRRTYRDALRAHAPGTRFVYLAGSIEVVSERVTARSDHFMPASLVTSQFALLEPLDDDEDGITLPLDWPVDRLLDHITARFADRPSITTSATRRTQHPARPTLGVPITYGGVS